MYIYIDESGIFANPQSKKTAVSCVVALVVPERTQEKLFIEYTKLINPWIITDEEIKGANLDEQKVAQVIDLLSKYDVLLDICAIDLGMHSDKEISHHKEEQAKLLTANLTKDHSPESIKNIKRLQNNLRSFSNQLYVQTLLNFQLINRTVNISTMYYCQRQPEELSNFHWIVDAKDQNLTSYEEYWSTTLAMYLQTISLRNSLKRLDDGDYTHFERFMKTEIPDYLKGIIPKSKDGKYVDATKLLRESLTFDNSKNNLGIQIADILANTFRRAIKNNLQIEGWGNLGRLMINQRDETIQMVMLSCNSGYSIKILPYAGIIKQIIKTTKSMWI